MPCLLLRTVLKMADIRQTKVAIKMKKTKVKPTIEQEVIRCLKSELADIEKRVTQLEPKPAKHWYKQFGVWFSILLTLLMLGMIYIFIMYEHGYHLIIPKIFKGG